MADERNRRPGDILVLGGLLVSVAGVVEGTLDLPDSLSEPAAPSGYVVTLGEQSVDVVARRDNELAIHGSGIDASVSGNAELTVTAPSGVSAVSPVRLWSYSLKPQPVTHVNVWAPITMECSGLHEESPVQVTFTPSPGQTIEPEQVTVNCPSLATGGEIARYKTSVAGQQPLNVHVEVLEK